MDNGKMESHTDMVKYSILIAITIIRVTFNKDYLLIMESILLIKSVILVRLILDLLKEKERIKIKMQLLKENLNKIILIKTVNKLDQIMSFKGSIIMESGKKEK
jgi:hypothetical protein